MNKTVTITACVFALLAVVLGAMGAHLLEKHLSAENLEAFETAVRYQMYHAIVLLIIGLFNKLQSNALYIFFTTGVCLFSGSIYFLSTGSLMGLNDLSFLGPITPIGGFLLICGWIVFIYKVVKIKDSKSSNS